MPMNAVCLMYCKRSLFEFDEVNISARRPSSEPLISCRYTTVMHAGIQQSLHIKPTSKHQYLHTKRCHPQHCKTAIPYSQALRSKRIGSQQENLLLRTNELKSHLSKRGYSKQLLDWESNWAINTSNNSSLLCSNHQNQNPVRLVVTYHPALPMLQWTIKHYHHILQDSEQLRKAIPSHPIITFRCPRNLRNLLVHATISLATFTAVLEGVRPAPYWSPQIYLSAKQLVNALNWSCAPSAKHQI